MTYYSIRQAAVALNVCNRTVRLRLKSGRMKGHLVDGRYLIPEREVMRWMGIRAQPGWPLGKKRKLSTPSV